MKRVLLLAICAIAASAQSTTTTYTKDINGNRVTGPSFGANDGDRTERFQSINGRQLPLEQTVDRVVSQDANSKVTERIVRKYDRNGNVASTERVMIEESKTPGGDSTVRETTYSSDVNGNAREAERKTTEKRVAGSTTTATTVIDRPSLSGSFQTVEKRSATTEGPADNQHITESVYERDLSGGYQERLRTVKTAAKSNDQTKETSASYEPGLSGQLQLKSQSESTSTKQADGTELIQTNLFAETVAGNVQDSSGKMRVKEQQLVERRKNPDGSVVEILSVRRPSVSDPTRLGQLQKISETVCKGKCEPDKTAAADSTKPDSVKSATGSSRP